MGRSGITKPVPCLASRRPPESLEITGIARSIASIAISPKPSYQSDGITRTRACPSASSMLSTLSMSWTLLRSANVFRSAVPVPQPAIAAKGYCRNRRASSMKMPMPFTWQGLIISTDPRSKQPSRGDVANRVDRRIGRLLLLVDMDEPLFIEGDLGVFQAEVLGVWRADNGDEDGA